MKLGQILSTRTDLLPPDYQAELARLQDSAPPVPVEAIREVLAAAASRRWPPAESYDLVGLAQEFAQTLRAELDYLREASTSRVLTLGRLRGIKIDDVAALGAAGIDRPGLADRAGRILLTMIFENGFFHADPHPGNFFVEPSGRIGLIDFGMVAMVDERTQEQLAGLLVAVTRGDAGQLADALVDLGSSCQRVERDRLARDLGRLMARYADRPLGGVAIGPLIEEALAMLLKTVVMSEGVGTCIDPGFRLTAVLAPYAETLVVRQYSPLRWVRRLGGASLEAARLGVELPEQIWRLIAQVEQGHLEVTVRPSSFEPVIRRFERLANASCSAATSPGRSSAPGEPSHGRRPPGAWASFFRASPTRPSTRLASSGGRPVARRRSQASIAPA